MVHPILYRCCSRLSLPNSFRLPSVGAARPQTIRMKVVLPVPFFFDQPVNVPFTNRHINVIDGKLTAKAFT